MMPPRGVRVVEPPGTTAVSPYTGLVGPTTCEFLIVIRMPSIDSQKSMPSVVASKVPEVSTLPVASSPTTDAGGTRPPTPTTVEAGSG